MEKNWYSARWLECERNESAVSKGTWRPNIVEILADSIVDATRMVKNELLHDVEFVHFSIDRIGSESQYESFQKLLSIDYDMLTTLYESE